MAGNCENETKGTIKKALDLWVSLTGVDLEATRWSFRDWTVATMNDELVETLRLDPEGSTTFLLLECFLREYLAQRSFTVAKIMQDYAGLTAYLAKAEELFSLVQSDEACEMAIRFRQRVAESLRHYGADREDALALVENPDVLPFLRRDALRSLNSLRAYQFLAGANDEKQPQAIDRVFQAWDVNQLLVALRDMPVSGVVLVLLRDPAHVDRSYFCFAMRNGDNVTILTDKTKWAHPAQADMMRRPDRAFQSRAWQNHFPYQLIKHGLNEKGDVVFETEKQLVGEGLDLAPLMAIRDLPAHQIVWIVMMLSLIAEKFWRKEWRAPALSYTGGMILDRSQIVTDKSGRQLPIAKSYQPITLDRLAMSDVTAAALAEQVNRKALGVNAWLEERYRDRVTEEAINLWAPARGEALLLPAAGKGTAIEVGNAQEHYWHNAARPYELRGMSPTEFGSEEDLWQDQVWLARFNMAKQIQKAADEEFIARKNEIFAWYEDMVKGNLPALLDAIAAGEMMGLRLDGMFGDSHKSGAFGNILTFGAMGDKEVWSLYDYSDGVCLGDWDKATGRHHRRCVLTGAAATYRARFHPLMADSLARLAGCRVDELPDVLRNWRVDKKYVGNNILDRLDPMESEVNDPWMKLRLNVNVYLSKRGYAKALRDAQARAGEKSEQATL